MISDLHIGDGGPRDQFSLGGRALELERFVDHVGRAGGELFILGDLFEFWQMNLSRLIHGNRQILDHFADQGALYVPGNHDVDLVHFIGTDVLAHPFFRRMCLPFSRTLGGKTFRFFHGHEVDPFNRGDDPGWGRMLSILAGIFEHENGSPLLKSGESVEAVLSQFGDAMLDLWSGLTVAIRHKLSKRGDTPPANRSLTPAQNPDRLGEHVQQVRQYLDQEAFDVAVLGHTHKAGHIDGWYFNSGTWTERQNPFLRITPSGEVGYFLWANGQAMQQPMPVAWEPPREPRKLPGPIAAARSTITRLLPNVRLERPPPAKRWLVAQGSLAIAAGVCAIALWGHGLDKLVGLFGAYTLASAVLDILSARRERSFLIRLFDMASAGVSVLFGAVALLRPSFSLGLLLFLIGAWALGVGCVRMAAATLLGPLLERRWLFAGGLTSAAVGVILMIFSGREVVPLAWALWAWVLFSGATQVVAGLWGRGSARGGFSLAGRRLARAHS